MKTRTAIILFLIVLVILFFWWQKKDAPAVVAVDPPLDVAQAQTQWRWIALRGDLSAPCPAAPGWTSQDLFQRRNQDALPPGLKGFCLYEFPRDSQVTSDDIATLEALQRAGKLAAIGRDAFAVAPFADASARGSGPRFGSELSGLLWPLLERQFVARAGRPVSVVQTDQVRGRLTIVDTAATNPDDPELHPGNSPHGFTLVNLARALLCDAPTRDESCIADVGTRLALRYVCFDGDIQRSECIDEVNGGFVGTISDLAIAIHDEVQQWQAPSDRLVINLSVAWDRRFGGFEDSPGDMPMAVRAVYSVLQDAACRGVLVVAAAGNRAHGPGAEAGPMLPAAWEQRAAPDPQTCAQIVGQTAGDAAAAAPGGQDGSGGAGGQGGAADSAAAVAAAATGAAGVEPSSASAPPQARSLIYAAGGIRHNDRPLFNARPGAAPRVAAFADHALVEWAGREEPTATLTGSSVSALVYAAAATAVRYYQPAMGPGDAAATVYRGGRPLKRKADFCLGGSATQGCPAPGMDVRAVSVCSAARAACADGGPLCAAQGALACAPVAALDVSGVDFSSFEDPAIAQQIDLNEVSATWPAGPPCSAQSLSFDQASPPANPCPQDQFFGLQAEPWVGPQPGSYPCPNCSTRISGGAGTLFLEIDSGFSGQVSDVTLVCGDDSYSLPLGTLAAGDKAAIGNFPCAGAAPVTLHFSLSGNQSAQSPVLLVD